MATSVIIPLAIDLLLKEGIPLLVKLADKLFGGKSPKVPNMGPGVKFPWVQTVVTGLQSALVSLGAATPADAAAIEGAIQKVYLELDAAGLLNGFATVIPPAIPTPVPGPTPAIALRFLTILESIAPSLGVKTS